MFKIKKPYIRFMAESDGDVEPDEGGGSPETFEFTNPKTGKKLNLPKDVDGADLQELIGHVIGKSRKDAEAKADKRFLDLKTAIDEKNSSVEDLQNKLQEIEDEKLSVEEKFKMQTQREIDKMQKLIDEGNSKANVNWELFKENKINNDILTAFSGYELCNPEQTMMVLRQLGNADFKTDEAGKHITQLSLMFEGEVEELNPKEAVQKWFALPENAHHLKNNLKSGGGTSSSGGRKLEDGTLVYTRADLQDDKKRGEYLEKIKKGETVQILEN